MHQEIISGGYITSGIKPMPSKSLCSNLTFASFLSIMLFLDQELVFSCSIICPLFISLPRPFPTVCLPLFYLLVCLTSVSCNVTADNCLITTTAPFTFTFSNLAYIFIQIKVKAMHTGNNFRVLLKNTLLCKQGWEPNS